MIAMRLLRRSQKAAYLLIVRIYTILVSHVQSALQGTSIRSILGIGLLIRIVLSIYTQESDLIEFAKISLSFLYGEKPYQFITIYPPGWVYYLSFVGEIYSMLAPPSSLLLANPMLSSANLQFGYIQPANLVNPAYSVIEKFPLEIADVALGFLLYKIVSRELGKETLGRIALAAWLFSPLSIVVSSVHGDYDVLPTLLGVTALVLVFDRRQFIGGISFGLAVMLKLFPIFLLPILVVTSFKMDRSVRTRITHGLLPFLSGVALPIALFFAPLGGPQVYLEYLTTGPRVGESFGGFGPLAWLSLIQNSTVQSILQENTAPILLVLTIIAVVVSLLLSIVVWGVHQRSLQITKVIDILVLIVTFSYLAVAYVQPQYLIWILPYLILGFVARRVKGWQLAIVSVLPALGYIFGLGGPLYFFEILGVTTHTLSLGWILSNVAYWYHLQWAILILTSVPTSLALLTIGMDSAKRIRK